MAKNKYKNRTLFKEAERIFVGGVNSPVRAFLSVGGDPVPIRRGRGAKIYDYDGNGYVDYVLSYGSLILGHARPELTRGIKNIVGLGLGFGATHDYEIKLAKRIQEAIPFIERIRFVTSGTEAVMGALRLARGFTGRNKIIKFERSYHGHADYLLARSGSGLATMGLPASKGVPNNFLRHTLVLPYGDKGSVKRIFDKHGSDIAAVVVEPVGGNNGVVPPNIEFLKYLRRITRKHGVLLVFDEVITGFRFHFGSAADSFKVKPDLICLGKIIGGGLPIGAYGGKGKIMNKLAPAGDVYQASTFSGNPIIMYAGLLTLERLKSIKRSYKYLKKLTERLSNALREKAESCGADVSIRHFGPMFSIHFKKRGFFKRFHRAMLERGIYFAPSEYESNFLSFAHKRKDIEETIRKADESFRLLLNKR